MTPLPCPARRRRRRRTPRPGAAPRLAPRAAPCRRASRCSVHMLNTESCRRGVQQPAQQYVLRLPRVRVGLLHQRRHAHAAAPRNSETARTPNSLVIAPDEPRRTALRGARAAAGAPAPSARPDTLHTPATRHPIAIAAPAAAILRSATGTSPRGFERDVVAPIYKVPNVN